MPDQHYGFGARLLHRLALSSKIVGQTCFDLERLFSQARTDTSDHHVFVTGLARAGTTVVMTALHDSGELRSLTYRDMPFVLIPSLWKRLSAKSRLESQYTERAHGDRVLVGFDSPEAFEEIFWRVFCRDDYIFQDYLIPHSVSEERLEQFRLFVQYVLASADESVQTRYLSKNNNNVLRMPAIKSAFPHAVFIVLFRDPVQQANSLLSQHTRFSQRHRDDKFQFQYMEWLGHHEFGLTHRRFKFNDDEGLDRFKQEDVNYWLCIWKITYRHVLTAAPADSIFISYEKLCASSESSLAKVFSAAKIGGISDFAFQSAQIRSVDGVDPVLQRECLDIYARLSDRMQ